MRPKDKHSKRRGNVKYKETNDRTKNKRDKEMERKREGVRILIHLEKHYCNTIKVYMIFSTPVDGGQHWFSLNAHFRKKYFRETLVTDRILQDNHKKAKKYFFRFKMAVKIRISIFCRKNLAQNLTTFPEKLLNKSWLIEGECE